VRQTQPLKSKILGHNDECLEGSVQHSLDPGSEVEPDKAECQHVMSTNFLFKAA